MNKIEIKDLCLLFGKEKLKAFKLLAKGKTKHEIRQETGCVIALILPGWESKRSLPK